MDLRTRVLSMIHTCPDTPHGFHAGYRPSYRKSQAEDVENARWRASGRTGLAERRES